MPNSVGETVAGTVGLTVRDTVAASIGFPVREPWGDGAGDRPSDDAGRLGMVLPDHMRVLP